MNNTRYAVVVTVSFDTQISVLLFNTQEAAMEFIKKDIVEEYESDIENGFDAEYVIYEDEGRAILTDHFGDTDDTTEWKIATVYDHED